MDRMSVFLLAAAAFLFFGRLSIPGHAPDRLARPL